MPIVKANEALPSRPVIMVLFGEPGATKTSIANTCENPLLIDADKGASRSHHRKDTLQLDRWEEVLTEEAAGTFKSYKTVVIDTAKAVLDDFLVNHVISKDYKLKTNKLQMYGAIGDEFKIFVNNRRSDQADLVIVCHAKKDEDTKRIIPDVTGGSYQLLMRIADQVGYVCIKNGQRVISFEPSELTVGKNVAGIPDTIVPPKDSVEFTTFGASLIERVRASISSMSEAQREALAKSEQYQEKIEKCDKPEDLTSILAEVNTMPEYLKAPLRKKIQEKAKAQNWIPNPQTKAFEVGPEQPKEEKAEEPKAEAPKKEEPKAETPAEQPKEEPKPEPEKKEGPEAEEEPAESTEDAFNKMMEQTESTPTEEIPRGGAKFRKTYEHPTTIEFVLNKAKSTAEAGELYFSNSALIEKTEGLFEKFQLRRQAIVGKEKAVA